MRSGSKRSSREQAVKDHLEIRQDALEEMPLGFTGTLKEMPLMFWAGWSSHLFMIEQRIISRLGRRISGWMPLSSRPRLFFLGHAHTQTHTHTYIRLFFLGHAHTQTHTHTYIHTHWHTFSHTHTHTLTHTHWHTLTHTSTHKYSLKAFPWCTLFLISVF